MDVADLIEGLSDPEAFPAASEVEVIQTHISVVFLAGPYVYKVKKPVEVGFLDFTTLERRHHFCEEEVRLNRRLAPHVYLGVVPITAVGDGLRVGGHGPALEYAVKMVRLPEQATLKARLEADALPAETIRLLAGRIADFHRGAGRGDEVNRFARWSEVAANARENLSDSTGQVGSTVSSQVFARLETALEDRLRALRPLIEARAARGVPRDTHGDLHLEHVYLLPDRRWPNDLVIVDCIEFNRRFRYADPVADMAFLAMDLAFHGRRDLEREFIEAYFGASKDEDGRGLVPFYESYRAAVRAKVEGILSQEPEVAASDREQAARSARGHWLLALSELEPPGVRPGLVLIGGLPGTGKTTLARHLVANADVEVISADLTRKRLAGISPDASAADEFERGIYAPEWTLRTYDACLSHARDRLFEGQRVLVDASFRDQARRQAFVDLATEMGVRCVLLICRSDPDVVRARMAARSGGASDADWAVHVEAARRWEAVPPTTARFVSEVDTAASEAVVGAEAMAILRRRGLADM